MLSRKTLLAAAVVVAAIVAVVFLISPKREGYKVGDFKFVEFATSLRPRMMSPPIWS